MQVLLAALVGAGALFLLLKKRDSARAPGAYQHNGGAVVSDGQSETLYQGATVSAEGKIVQPAPSRTYVGGAPAERAPATITVGDAQPSPVSVGSSLNVTGRTVDQMHPLRWNLEGPEGRTAVRELSRRAGVVTLIAPTVAPGVYTLTGMGSSTDAADAPILRVPSVVVQAAPALISTAERAAVLLSAPKPVIPSTIPIISAPSLGSLGGIRLP